MTIHYEALTPGQASAYQTLRRVALQNDPQSFGTTLDEFNRDTTETISKQMVETLEDGGRYIMAYDDANPVGMATLLRRPATRRKQAHIGFVVGVYVVASYRGRGVGRGMLTRLIAFARTQPGLEILQLAVVTDNEAARGLYEALGFVYWGTEPCAMKGEHGCVDQDRMALRL